MNFVNNWNRPITLAAGVTSVALDIPDGEYRLSLADSATEPTRQEIIGATVASGTATLTRGLEGTLDQDWPAGSTIYNAVTAGWLNGIDSRVKALEQGGGGEGGAVVSDSPPDSTPAFTGQLYVREGVAGYIALASDSPEGWSRFSGMDEPFGYYLSASSPGVAYDVARFARKIMMVAEPGTLPEGFQATLRMPAWQGRPHGWALYIEAGNLALSLDFSAVGPIGSFVLSDYGTDTGATVDGSVLTVANNQPITISISELQLSDQGGYCGIDVRAHAVPTVSFLN